MKAMSKQDNDTQAVKVCRDVNCDRPGEELPLSEFGKNRALKYGKDSYCSRCRVRRIRAYREQLELNRKPVKKAPSKLQRVREAIENGFRTQDEIAQETKLTLDQIGEVLVVLCLEERTIYSTREADGDRRFYLTKAA